MTEDQPPPLPIISGNLPLEIRWRVPNPDGSVSTVRTISMGTDKGEVLIPTVYDNRIMTNEEAWQRYKKTGENFGTFGSVAEANAYAQWLHRKHEAELARVPMTEMLNGGK